MPHMYYKMCRNENGNSRYTSYRGEIGIREIQCNDGMKGTYLAACDCNNGLMNKIKSCVHGLESHRLHSQASSNVICYATERNRFYLALAPPGKSLVLSSI